MNDENYNIIVSYCDTIDLNKTDEEIPNIEPIKEVQKSNSQHKNLCYPNMIKKSSKEIINSAFKTADLNNKKQISFLKKYSKSFNGEKQVKSNKKIKFNELVENEKIENIMFDAYKKTDNFEEFYKELTNKKFIIDDETDKVVNKKNDNEFND